MTWKTASVPRHIESAVSTVPGRMPGDLKGRSPWSQRGRTLLEMIIVVAIISLAAAIAVPSGNSTQLHRLTLSVTEVADAFRFSRDEARRTGVPHGVSLNVSANTFHVFRLDEAPDPNIRMFDVYHPVTKQSYTVQLDDPPYAGTSLSSVGGQLIGPCGEPDQIVFDASGVVRCSEPSTTRINNATVELTTGEVSQRVVIDGYTGRVFIQ